MAEQFQLLCRVRDDKNGNGGQSENELRDAALYQFLALFYFCDKFTCVFAAELVFFFSSFLFWGEIFLSARWGFFFSAAQFVSLPLRLCALVSFRHLYLQINQTKKHLCLNEASSFYPPLCAASWFGVFVRADGQEVAELWR